MNPVPEGHRANGGSGYCDDYCDRPPPHDGLCWGKATGCVWREATPEEIAEFEREARS